MSIQGKTRVALLLLVFFAAWPLAHRSLVVNYGVSPWKLYGWAMYCTPRFEVEMLFVGNKQGQEDRKPTVVPYPLAFKDAKATFEAYQKRMALGSLASTDALAAVTFDAYPALAHLTIRRFEQRFDIEEAKPVREHVDFTYERPSATSLRER